MLLVFLLHHILFVGAALVAARASPVGADAHTSPPAGGDKPRPYAPGETLVRRKRRPTLWGPRGQKEDAVIPRPT